MHSGLQKKVLRLYRQALLMVRSKDEVRRDRIPPSNRPVLTVACFPPDGRAQEARPAFYRCCAYYFRSPQAGGAPRPRDVAAIEYLVRRGERQLEMLGKPEVRKVTEPEGAHSYPLGWAATASRR